MLVGLSSSIHHLLQVRQKRGPTDNSMGSSSSFPGYGCRGCPVDGTIDLLANFSTSLSSIIGLFVGSKRRFSESWNSSQLA